MKVYIVKAPQGEYEEYEEPIVAVFSTKQKAVEYINKKNISIKEKIKCDECPFQCSSHLSKEEIINLDIPKCCEVDKDSWCKNQKEYNGEREMFIEEWSVK